MRDEYDKADSSTDFRDTLGGDRTECAVFQVGQMVRERYEVMGYLGGGGMSDVWKALDHDTDPPTPVALKVLSPSLARSASGMPALQREASISLKLTHPNICRLYTFHLKQRPSLLVMEYVEGKTLAEILVDYPDRMMRWEDLEPVARQIAEALDYAHGIRYADASGRMVKGVLHRDIKPENIMVSYDGTARLMDFGIAREIHNTETRVGGHPSKTPPYASPEQFRGWPMTAASDVYSFAAVLYECLAGRQYISSEGDMEYQILKRDYLPLNGTSGAVNHVLSQGLARNPHDRPKTALALVDLLGNAMASKDDSTFGARGRGASSSKSAGDPAVEEAHQDQADDDSPSGFAGAGDDEDTYDAGRDDGDSATAVDERPLDAGKVGGGVNVDISSAADQGPSNRGTEAEYAPEPVTTPRARRASSPRARPSSRRSTHGALGTFLLLVSVSGGVFAYESMDLGYVFVAGALALMVQAVCRNLALSVLVSVFGMIGVLVTGAVVTERFLAVELLLVPIGLLGAVPAIILSRIQASRERARRRGN